MDMLNGGLAGKLILFSIPLAFSSILQQLFNSADVAVVGRFAGEQALAAVGSCVALVGIFVNLIVGLSVGPNAALANLIGQKNRGKINSIGPHDPDLRGGSRNCASRERNAGGKNGPCGIRNAGDSAGSGTLIYQDLFCGNSVYGHVQLWCAIVRSYGDTRRPMYYLIVSGVLNVILNLLLVIGFHLGVAAVATARWSPTWSAHSSLSPICTAGMMSSASGLTGCGSIQMS